MHARRLLRWLPAARRYLVLLALGNLLWEIAQLPLYTIWREAPWPGIVFAVAHCTAGDLLIGMSALVLALIVVGDPRWPRRRFAQVALVAIAIGVAYTIYSEWLNVEVRGTWSYTAAMPRLPWLGTGLAPLAQWLIVPALAFWRVARSCATRVADL